MIDFDSLKHKAEEFVEQHENQIDKGIDKAAGVAGKKYGHRSQIDQAARKLKDLTDDGKADEAKPHPRPAKAAKPHAQKRVSE
jgi:hypothetical protein